jgi:phage shock protein A
MDWKFYPFYAPEDGSGGGSGGDADPNQGDGSANGSTGLTGTVTVKLSGDQSVDLDLSKDADWKKYQAYAQKGTEYHKLKDELSSVQLQLNNWNAAINEAARDESGKKADALIQKIEAYTGQKFLSNRQQSSSGNQTNNDPLGDDPLQSKIDALEQQLLSFKQGEEQKANQEYMNRLDAKLTSMEADNKAYPHFNRDEVEKHALKLGSDNFDLVYMDLYRSKIEKDLIDKAAKDTEERLKNLGNASLSEAGASQGTDLNLDIKKKVPRSKRYEKIGEAVLAKNKAEGRSFFTN